MNVGFVGLGKLGLPVAYALASRGLVVYGHDPVVNRPPERTGHEEGFADVVAQAGNRLRFCDLAEMTAVCDVAFVAVQTPHEPQFEGVTPLPQDRADFDYTYLVQAVRQIVKAAGSKPLTLVVISTVLPGTMAAYVQPWLPDTIQLVYNPSFIAMGTTVEDFLDPEFVLLGGDTGGAARAVYDEAGITENQSAPWTAAQVYETTVQNAELIKVAYNTFIGLKIAFANTLMEVCHKTQCDVDEVTGGLKQAHRRLISTAYLDGGMGDGGGCHPRDNIALSWLARKLNLSYDLFGAAMECRERQAAWLCDLMERYELPKAILGTEYKPGSDIETGSAAVLCRNLLLARGHTVESYKRTDQPDQPCVFLIGCRHEEFEGIVFPEGSVVIDPFRYIEDQDGVEVIRIGQWEPVPTDTSASTTPPLAA